MSKKACPLPEQSELLQIFDLDPDAGVLTRKSDGRSAWKRGSSGYATVSVGGKGYLLHRIIWVMAHGPLGEGHVDHVNGDKEDNRLENLRLADPLLNSWNKKTQQRNKLGFKGVKYDRKGKAYRATITHKGKSVALGSFKTPEEASEAYRAAAVRLRGFFANGGDFCERVDAVKAVAANFKRFREQRVG